MDHKALSSDCRPLKTGCQAADQLRRDLTLGPRLQSKLRRGGRIRPELSQAKRTVRARSGWGPGQSVVGHCLWTQGRNPKAPRSTAVPSAGGNAHVGSVMRVPAAREGEPPCR